jgi:hypothetical protein
MVLNLNLISIYRDSLLKEEFNVNPTWDYFQTRDYVVKFFNRVNYTDELKKRFIQYFESPKNHQAFCGVSIRIVDFTLNFSV